MIDEPPYQMDVSLNMFTIFSDWVSGLNRVLFLRSRIFVQIPDQ